MQEKNSTIITLILSGLFALLGTVVGTALKGYWDVQLADRKYQSDLVLKALESSSAEERLETLRMLVHTNLIKEPDISLGVDSYIKQKQANPSSIPQVKPSVTQALDSPIIDNARIYLLAGNKAKSEGFEALQNELSVAGFTVVGARSIIDPGRQNQPEVRYFNEVDQTQADKIAKFVQSKLSDNAITARFYKDVKAKAGYIEIWLGR